MRKFVLFLLLCASAILIYLLLNLREFKDFLVYILLNFQNFINSLSLPGSGFMTIVEAFLIIAIMSLAAGLFFVLRR